MSDRFGSISIQPSSSKSVRKKPPGQRIKKTRKEPRRKKQDSRQSRNIVIFLIIATFCFGLYVGCGFYLAPLLLKKYGPAWFEDLTGMTLKLDRVTFNPLNFTLALTDFSLNIKKPVAQDPPLLHVSNLLAALDMSSLLRNGLVCHSVKITTPKLNIIRYKDKNYNLPPRLKKTTPSDKSEIIEFASLPFLFSFNNIAISDGEILFDDRLNEKQHTGRQVQLALPVLSNFSFNAKEYIRPHFSAIIDGSPFELTGEAAFVSPEQQGGLETKLSCDIHNLDLPLYFDYLPKSFPAKLTKGKSSGKLQISYAPDGKKNKRLTIGFQLSVTDAEIIGKDKRLGMKIPAAKLAGQLHPISRSLHLQSVIFREPQFTASSPFPADSIRRIFPAPKNTDSGKTSNQELSIGLLIIDNGDLNFTDTEAKTNKSILLLEQHWTSLQLSMKDFSNTALAKNEQGSFRLTGEQADHPASFSWHGSFTEQGMPSGSLELHNIEAAQLLTHLGSGFSQTMKGTGDLRGHLTISRNDKNKKLFQLTDTMAELHDLQLFQDKKEWFRAKTVRVKGATYSTSHPNLGNISSENSVLTLNQGELPDFLKRFSKNKGDISLHGLEFSGSILCDAENKTRLSLNDVRLQLNQLNKEKPSANNFAFSARLRQKGEIKSKGTVSLFPLKASLTTAFASLSGKELFPWLPPLPIFNQTSLTLHGKGTLIYPGPTFSGKLQLDNGVITNPDETPFFTWNKALCNNVIFSKTPLHLGISSLDFDGAKITFSQTNEDQPIFSRLKTLFQNVVPEATSQPAGKKRSINLSRLDIQEITFKNSSLTYRDKRLTPSWQTELTDLHGNLKSIHDTKSAISTFQINGQLAESPLSVAGSANIFGKPVKAEAQLSLSGFALNSFSEQLSSVLDINPFSGSFDLTLQYYQENGKEKTTAHYLFSSIYPSSQKADTNLPLGLLTNSDDQFELLVEAAGSLRPSLFQQTINKFQTLQLKAQISPLLLSGSQFLNLGEHNHIPFPIGSSELKKKGEKLLQHYQKLIVAHPRLALQINGIADPVTDREGLKNRLSEQEQRRIEEENRRLRHEYQIRNKIPPENQTPQPSFVPLRARTITVNDKDLLKLATERAFAIYNYCTSQLEMDPNNLILNAKAELAMDSTPGNRVDIHLGINAQSLRQDEEQIRVHE